MIVIPISREFIGAIRNGTKVSTIRRGTRTYPLGPAIMRADQTDIEIELINIRFKKFKDLNETDATRDGFSQLASLHAALRRFYPSISNEEQVTIVEFRKR